MSDEEELAAATTQMSPAISDLLRRMMEDRGLTWDEARAYRDEIVSLNKDSRTDEEQSALLFAFLALMDRVEVLGLVEPRSLDRLQSLRKADYLMMLNVQAMVGDAIDPDRLEHVARREVEAGRLSADDDFRQFAAAGAVVLGKSAQSGKGLGWLRGLFRIK